MKMRRRRSSATGGQNTAASSSATNSVMGPASQESMGDLSPSGSGSESSLSNVGVYNDRKKQTHLRCERQRREAINSGYNELKELIPQTTSSLGCKTTNAAVLFRACEYIHQLTNDVESGDKELQQLNTQVAALEMIAAQYESMAASAPSSSSSNSVQARMLQTLLDDCYASFVSQVDISSYSSLTRTLLTWVESLAATNDNFKETMSKLVTMPFQLERKPF
ncbi:hypothetical protein WR25_01106 [Diploscapter pachys]|uniref:BHLH domain-containing protein n=1 Tax=Diploscapter pachys TaxID=2018661 RepID=A0A2A2J382_9BILA|nr:hypothetical protein WR25_01106 [Diploscapter pachys]